MKVNGMEDLTHSKEADGIFEQLKAIKHSKAALEDKEKALKADLWALMGGHASARFAKGTASVVESTRVEYKAALAAYCPDADLTPFQKTGAPYLRVQFTD